MKTYTNNNDTRFLREKAEYKGPWIVPKRRAKKNPLAPKRPPSAFLKFSKKRRSEMKSSNPDLSNTDVSMLLGEEWRNATAKEKEPYVGQEERERAIYNEKIKTFREEEAKVDAASRTSHKSVQKMTPPDHPQHGYAEASRLVSFDPIRHADIADDESNKGDQRVMFRHSFGGTFGGPAPFSSYHPSWGKFLASKTVLLLKLSQICLPCVFS
jgi:hypothetical protein